MITMEPTAEDVPAVPEATPGSALIRMGYLGLAVGIPLFIVGLVLTFGGQVLQVATADGRALVGNPITVEANDGRYAITLLPDPTSRDYVEERIAQLDCTVDHGDGTSEDLNPASAKVRTSGVVGVFAADFTGRSGATTVLCTWSGSDMGSAYAVSRATQGFETAALAALAAGAALTLLAIAAMVSARRRALSADPAVVSPSAR